MIKIERLRFRYIWSMLTRRIHECWHVRTNKCVRTNICRKLVFAVSVRNINICGRFLTQFTGLLQTNTVAAERELLTEHTSHGSKPLTRSKISEISRWQKCFSELKISNPRISCTLHGVRRSSWKVVWVTKWSYASETSFKWQIFCSYSWRAIDIC